MNNVKVTGRTLQTRSNLIRVRLRSKTVKSTQLLGRNGEASQFYSTVLPAAVFYWPHRRQGRQPCSLRLQIYHLQLLWIKKYLLETFLVYIQLCCDQSRRDLFFIFLRIDIALRYRRAQRVLNPLSLMTRTDVRTGHGHGLAYTREHINANEMALPFFLSFFLSSCFTRSSIRPQSQSSTSNAASVLE